MRWFLLLFTLFALRVFGATGDITDAYIRTDGWSADIVFEGLSSGGTYDFGIGTNNTLTGAEKVILTVSSPGFDAAGASNWTSRVIVGTLQVRSNYPNHAITDERVGAGYVTNRIALSEDVFVGDSVSVVIKAGLYTESGNPSAARSFAITNNSTATVPMVVGNWGVRPYRAIRAANLDLACGAWHDSGIARVEFRVTDSGGTSFTNVVYEMTMPTVTANAVQTALYRTLFPTNTFVAGLLRCNFRAYPNRGVSTSVLDTEFYGSEGSPTPYPCTHTNGLVPLVRAVVAASGGNDSTAVAYNEANWPGEASATRFATLGRAIIHVYGTNNGSYSRAGYGGGIVYLDSGTHTILGSSVSLANAPDLELRVTRLSSLTRDEVVIGTYGTDRMATSDNARDLITYDGLTFDSASSDAISMNPKQLAFVNTHVPNWLGIRLIVWTSGACSWTMESCTVSNITPGLSPYSGGYNLELVLLSDIKITGDARSASLRTAIGNERTSTALGSFSITTVDAGGPDYVPIVIYNNRWMNLSNTTPISIGGSFSTTNGAAIVQNIFETTCGDPNGGAYILWVSDSYSHTNLLLYNNAFIGTKANAFYNASGTAAAWRCRCALRGNIFDWQPVKADDFSPENAARIGNWPILYGVNHENNAHTEAANISTPASFRRAFYGLGSFSDASGNGTNYAAFLDLQAYTGLTNSGSGDYRLSASSPLHGRNRNTRILVPYDIAGVPRTGIDPPGPHANISPKRFSFFMP